MSERSYERSYQMYAEAQRVSPDGYQGPQSPRFFQFGAVPVFAAEGKGCRFIDVDGNEYIDFLCGLGAVVLGMRHPAVETAVRAQAERGDCMTFPSRRWPELAEYLVRRIPGMDWAIFGKNGSDVTSYMTQVARAHTGRPGIAMFQGAYHGFHFWCEDPHPGIPPEYQAHVHSFRFNDLDDFERVVREQGGRLAAVICTPVRHDLAQDQELPAPGFFAGIRRICDREGMLLLLDDIRCGFRYHPDGSAVYFDIDADMIAFGKSISNGYPISAAMGKQQLMEVAKSFLFIGTHFYSAVPMAAALACLEEIENSDAVSHMLQMGELLRSGMQAAAAARGVGIRHTGHPTMPLLLFEDDPEFARAREFSRLAAARGVIFHPLHNWFICAAHRRADIEQAVAVSEECFRLMR
jgi:glutamate-1-semialdehyde 2,1-aminomutase